MYTTVFFACSALEQRKDPRVCQPHVKVRSTWQRSRARFTGRFNDLRNPDLPDRRPISRARCALSRRHRVLTVFRPQFDDSSNSHPLEGALPCIPLDPYYSTIPSINMYMSHNASLENCINPPMSSCSSSSMMESPPSSSSSSSRASLTEGVGPLMSSLSASRILDSAPMRVPGLLMPVKPGRA